MVAAIATLLSVTLATTSPGRAQVSSVPEGALFQLILEVGDMGRQVAFYRDALGLPLVDSEEGTDVAERAFVRFATAGANLALHLRTGPERQRTAARMSFMARDIAARRKELLEKGVEMGPIRSPAAGVLITDGHDPEGNIFHIEARVEPPSNPVAAEADVRSILEAWFRSFNQKNWGTYLDLYGDDPRFHLHEVGRTLYASKDAVDEAFRSAYNTVTEASLTARQLSVVAVSDTIVLAQAEYAQTLEFQDGVTVHLAGTMHLFMERNTTGWHVVAGDAVARGEA